MNIVIIGNGVAGITCAQVARQRDAAARITVVSGESDYFFSRTALMYSYMDKMTRRDLEPLERSVYVRQRIELLRDWVVDMDPAAGTIQLERGGALPYDRLVFAVGARPNMFPWTGADAIEDGLVHFVSMQDLDDCERLTKTSRQAVVVGGGLIGVELVESLLYHGVKTTFLVREPSYYWPMALGREEADYISDHLRQHGVDVRLGEEIDNIQVDSQGRVSGIVTNHGHTLPCQMLGIAVGVRPNIDRMREFTTGPELGRGIKVDPTLVTNLPGVFACGDCAEIHLQGRERPLNELIWYSAKRQGALVGRNLFGDSIAYEPPLYFNSSKFFEVEYTTVGSVMDAPEGAPTLYRKLPGKNVSQRIVHDGERVLGFNMLGSRWNHEILERWIAERRSADWVEKNLRTAQYDVEFGRAPLHKHTVTPLPLHKEWP